MKKHTVQKIACEMYRGFARMTQPVLVALLMLETGIALQASDRQLGDIFVAIGNSSYQVYHNNALAETITDTAGGGSTAGCAFDSTYHAFTTNVTNNDVFRHRLDDPQTAFPAISVVGAGGGQPTSIAFDSLGNSYVGNAAGNGLIEEYDATGTFVQTLPASASGGSPWIDLSADATKIYFTNGTNNIFISGQPLPFASVPGVTFFAIRVIPNTLPDGTAAPFAGDVLAAAGKNIQLLNTAGTSIHTYKVSGQNDLEVLTLDPNGTSFWAGNPSTQNFYRINLTSGNIEVSLNTGVGAGPFGLCAYGGFSAAQPQPVLVTQNLTPLDPTFDTPIPPPSGPNHFTSTLFNLNGNVTATLQYLQIPQVAGSSDTSLPCLLSSPGNNPQCEVYSLSFGLADNQIPQHDLAIFSVQSSLNPVALENEVNDITDFVFHGSTRTGGSCVNPPCNSTFTVHEQTLQAVGDTSCGYSSPLPGQLFTAGRAIPFKFSAKQSGGTCAHGPFLTNIVPSLVVVQLNHLTTSSDAPHFVAGAVKGGSGTPLFYRSNGNGWIINFDTSGLMGTGPDGLPTNYLATTFDATNTIPAFNCSASSSGCVSDPITFSLR